MGKRMEAMTTQKQTFPVSHEAYCRNGSLFQGRGEKKGRGGHH